MSRQESHFDWLFGQAKDLTPEQQEAFLNRECQDEALRAEVSDLLEHHRKLPTDSFANPLLQGDAVVHAFDAGAGYGDGTGSDSAADVFLLPGKRVGKYKIRELLGEGGMGAVFVAEQTEPVNRRVALKVIKPGINSKDTLARFEAERQALSMMDHPNIARILDAGATDSGRPYFVMELVKGVAITDYCDRQKLNAKQRLELFVSVCQAVAHAHQKGIIHRDIKPSNVLIADYDDKPVVKVIDFGVAKATTQKLSDKTVYTRFGQLIGTFEYMSPEQAKLNQLDVDTRSDVYSLGVLLYELLTGSTPIDRERLRSAALNEMVRIICEEDPPKPSTRLTKPSTRLEVAANRRVAPAQLANTVRGELDWIVMRSLEKERKRRYQSASDFAQDVQRFLSGDVVEACPPTWTYRTKMFLRRNRIQVGTAGALVFFLSISSVAGWLAYTATVDKNSALQEEARIQSAIRLAAESEANMRVAHPVASMRQAIQAVETTYLHDGNVLEIARQKLQYALGRLGGIPLFLQDGSVSSASISSDGRWLATGGDEAGLFLNDLDHLESAPLRLPHRNATHVRFTSDMRWLVTAGQDGVMLWKFDGTKTVECSLRLRNGDTERQQATKLVVSDNGRWAAVSFYGGYVHIWDLQAGDPAASERILSVHADATMQEDCLAINVDGTRFITSCSNGKVFLWDLNRDQLEPLRAFPHQRRLGGHVALSTDGRWFAVSHDGLGQLWDLSRPDQEAITLGGAESKEVRFSDNDRYLTVGGDPCFLYDLTAEDVLASRIALDVAGSTPVMSPGNRWLVNEKDHAIQLWNLSWLKDPRLPIHTEVDGTRFRTWSPAKYSSGSTVRLHGHDERITAMQFTPDGSALVTGSWDGSARLWKLDQTNPTGNHAFRSSGIIQCTSVSPDGKWLVVGREGPVSRLWPLQEGQGLTDAFILQNANDGIGKVAFSPDGRWLVGTSAVPTFRSENRFARNEQVAHVWDLRLAVPGEQAFELPHGGAVTSLVFEPAGSRLFTGCTDGTMRVWSLDAPPSSRLLSEYDSTQFTTDSPELLASEKTASALEGKAAEQMIVDVAGGGSTAVSGTGRGQVLVWDLSNNRPPKQLTGMTACPLDVAISTDGRWVAAGGAYEGSYAWDLMASSAETGIRIPTLWNSSFVTNVDFAPDGRWLATGSWDKTTNLFDLHKSNPFAAPARTIHHKSGMVKLAFNTHHRQLIAGSDALPIVVTLPEDPSNQIEFTLPVEEVGATALTPDGKRAITGSRHELRIWELETKPLVSAAKSRLQRSP